jgi:hypothetical protein
MPVRPNHAAAPAVTRFALTAVDAQTAAGGDGASEGNKYLLRLAWGIFRQFRVFFLFFLFLFFSFAIFSVYTASAIASCTRDCREDQSDDRAGPCPPHTSGPAFTFSLTAQAMPHVPFRHG